MKTRARLAATLLFITTAPLAAAFNCAQPASLATLEVLLFDAFKRIEKVDVQAVLAKGQRKAVLRRSARVLKLGA